MIDGEADVTFWVPVSLLLKLFSLFCMMLWINAKNVLYLLLYSSSVFLWLSAKFCNERTFFLMNWFFLCFLGVFLLFFLVIKTSVHNLSPKDFSFKQKQPCCIKAVTIDELSMGNELEVVSSS